MAAGRAPATLTTLVSGILTRVNLADNPSPSHDRSPIPRSEAARYRGSHAPPHPAGAQATRPGPIKRTLSGKTRRPVRRRYRRARSPVAADHLASHGNPDQGRASRGREAGPMALV